MCLNTVRSNALRSDRSVGPEIVSLTDSSGAHLSLLIAGTVSL